MQPKAAKKARDASSSSGPVRTVKRPMGNVSNLKGEHLPVTFRASSNLPRSLSDATVAASLLNTFCVYVVRSRRKRLRKCWRMIRIGTRSPRLATTPAPPLVRAFSGRRLIRLAPDMMLPPSLASTRAGSGGTLCRPWTSNSPRPAFCTVMKNEPLHAYFTAFSSSTRHASWTCSLTYGRRGGSGVLLT